MNQTAKADAGKHYRILKNVWENADWTHLEVKKPDWCPLVEVPKGARLIDARDVKKHMIPLDFSVQNWISEWDLDINVPTIFKDDEE